jgi:hypothetical protein
VILARNDCLRAYVLSLLLCWSTLDLRAVGVVRFGSLFTSSPRGIYDRRKGSVSGRDLAEPQNNSLK